MFLFAVCLLAVGQAAETCIVCSAEESQTVKTFSQSLSAQPGVNNDCFRNPTSTNYPTASCDEGCYSLFYALQMDGRDGTKVEKTVVERGCIYKKKVNGLSISFPAKVDSCTSGSLCAVTLNEKNYGNRGTIKAQYETKAADNNPSGFPTGNQITWNAIGLKCYQCHSRPQASITSMDACYNGGSNMQPCADINSTTCVSTVSNYELFEEMPGTNGTYGNYQYAMRGCSNAPSSYAAKIANPVISHGMVHQDELGSFVSAVNRTLETTFCDTNGCNVQTMKYLSSSASSLFNLVPLLFAISFCL